MSMLFQGIIWYIATFPKAYSLFDYEKMKLLIVNSQFLRYVFYASSFFCCSTIWFHFIFLISSYFI